MFGVGMMKELARHGYKIGPGTLYPLLHRLHADGLLALDTEAVDGKIRKYYTITRKGRAVLNGIRPKLAELAEEVLADPSASPSSGSNRLRGTDRK